MDLSKLALIFKIIIIGIIYIIIVIALRIMYKDIKNGGRKVRVSRKTFGLEITEAGINHALRKGAVIPVKADITIGRKNDNLVVLEDPYASGHHARVYIKNGECALEDLGSTNGTFLNGRRIVNREYLKPGDEIRIGDTCFRVI